MSNTFFQLSLESLIERLSKVIPALFTRISNPSNLSCTLLIKSSILSWWSNLNCSVFIDVYLFSNFLVLLDLCQWQQ